MSGIRLDYDSVQRCETYEVDHSASAKANLKAVGEDFKSAFTPDRLMNMIAGYGSGGGGPLEVLPVAGGALVDLLELGALPFVAAKDAADAAVHGILSLFKK